MTSKTYYYARVSTSGQNLDRQIEAFRSLGADERDIITDKASGKDMERSGYQALKQHYLRAGDTLVIKSLDRLSRCKADVKAELEYFRANQIRVKVLDIPTTMYDFPQGQEWVLDMVNNILIEVLGSIAEQERCTIKQRQAEGIACMQVINGKHISTKTGRAVGRPNATVPAEWDSKIAAWRAGQITATQAMQELGIPRTTFYRLLKQQQGEQ